jgi:hypothetical protein
MMKPARSIVIYRIRSLATPSRKSWCLARWCFPPGQRNLLEFVDTTLLDEVEKEGFIQKLR